jgi:hypothetical protein
MAHYSTEACKRNPQIDISRSGHYPDAPKDRQKAFRKICCQCKKSPALTHHPGYVGSPYIPTAMFSKLYAFAMG